MKLCSKCNQIKNNTEFYKQSDRKNGASLCKECFNMYCINRWVERKKKAIEYKGGKCQECGYNKYYGALHFHHRNPLEKNYSWTKLRLLSWDKVLVELNKCDLLCANCHAEKHQL